MDPVSGFVLAGGKSSRMGRDKGALSLDGRTLTERALELAGSIAEYVRVVGAREKYGADAIEDIYPDCGPLGGIHAALTSTTTEWNLVLAVDTPFVTPAFVRFLVEEAQRAGTTVTVPFAGGRFQPLCAVYRRGFLALAEAGLQADSKKIDSLFPHTTVRRVDEAEMMRLAFDPRMFDNLNTPEDFVRAQRRR